MATTNFVQYFLCYNELKIAEGDHNPYFQPFDLGLSFAGSSLLVQFLSDAPPEWNDAGVIRQVIDNTVFQPSNVSEQAIELDRATILINTPQAVDLPKSKERYRLIFEPRPYVDRFTLRVWQFLGEGSPFFQEEEGVGDPTLPTLEELGGVPLELLAQPLGIATLGADGILAEDQRPPAQEIELPENEPWQALPLLGGWQPVGSGYGGNYLDPRFKKDLTGKVVLEGLMVNGSTSDAFVAVAKLPENYRPTKRRIMSGNNANRFIRVDLDPDGTIYALQPSSSEFISLFLEFDPA